VSDVGEYGGLSSLMLVEISTLGDLGEKRRRFV